MQNPGLDVYDWWGSHPTAFDLLMKVILAGVEKPLRTLATARLDASGTATVLDLGSGTGPNVPYLRSELDSDGQIVELEFSQAMIRTARERLEDTSSAAGVAFVRGDARRLGIATESVDGVLATLLLSALPDYEQVVTEVYRVLKPGRRFVLLDGRPFQRGPLRMVNPLVVSILRQLTNWYPSSAILETVRQTFDEVTVESFNAGALYLATARKRPGESSTTKRSGGEKTQDR
jgi:demethylmenaquinone methyltransferase/2-methoxy-6-polyprenyl-1,4-benzoquinol methylase